MRGPFCVKHRRGLAQNNHRQDIPGVTPECSSLCCQGTNCLSCQTPEHHNTLTPNENKKRETIVSRLSNVMIHEADY